MLVKPTYLDGAGYCEVAGVAPGWQVAELHAHVLSALRLHDVAPVQLSLRLVARGGSLPDAAAERLAARLDDPTAPLAAAGVAEGAWLLANLRSAQPRFDTVRDITLLTDLVDSPDVPYLYLPRLSGAELPDLFSTLGAVGFVEEKRVGAPLLRHMDQLRDGAAYYIMPALGALSDKVVARTAACVAVQPGAIVLTCLCIAGEEAA